MLNSESISLKMVQLLLDNGFNPYAKTENGETALDYLKRSYKSNPTKYPEYEQIKALLEKAMQKYQQ